MRIGIGLVIGALALIGCGPSQPPSAPVGESSGPQEGDKAPPGHPHPHAHGQGPGHDHGDVAKMCPMAVEGTTTLAEDTEGGAAIVFTTTGDVVELRRRIALMAEKHNGKHAAGHSCMMHGDSPMPATEARSEEVERGARLVFKATNAADLAKLRAHVRHHAEMMASGSCPMMGKHAGPAPHGGPGAGHGPHHDGPGGSPPGGSGGPPPGAPPGPPPGAPPGSPPP